MSSSFWSSAVLPLLLASIWLPLGAVAQARPPRVTPPDADLTLEQAYLDELTLRYSVEIADDENLPQSFRKRDSPQGASLLNLSW